MNKKHLVIVLICIVLIGGAFYLFQLKSSSNDGNYFIVSDKKAGKGQDIQSTISINNNLKLVGSKPYYVEKYKDNSFTKVSISNKGKEQTILESGKRISFATFNDQGLITLPNKQKAFVLYNYTLYKDFQKKTKEKVENGYIYTVDSDGNVKLFYKTHYIYDSVTIENGVFTIYERLPKDPTNMYPSYLKPYYKLKFQYENGQFVLKGKTYIDTIAEYKKGS